MKKNFIALLVVICVSSFAFIGDPFKVSNEDSLISVKNERDEIFMLLAYSVVLDNWQTYDSTRGYNIGGVLVNDKGEVVNWARNSTKVCFDKTAHGEVRLLQSYLNDEKTRKAKIKYVDGCTVYTTLEPCMMCSGMLIFLKTDRVVYGQTDPGYGLNIERLQSDIVVDQDTIPANSRAKSLDNSLCKSDCTKSLDSAYSKFKGKGIVDFLYKDEARRIYIQAREKLLTYEVVNDENKKILKNAQNYLKKVEEKEVKDPCIKYVNR